MIFITYRRQLYELAVYHYRTREPPPRVSEFTFCKQIHVGAADLGAFFHQCVRRVGYNVLRVRWSAFIEISRTCFVFHSFTSCTHTHTHAHIRERMHTVTPDSHGHIDLGSLCVRRFIAAFVMHYRWRRRCTRTTVHTTRQCFIGKWKVNNIDCMV